MNILLLEDETILKESIEEFLISKSYSIDSFENSNDAFDAIFSKEYDLLLLDVNVPGDFDGFSLRKELSDENKNIPTIFVTSMSSADAMLQGYANGCCDYIKKPFDLIELLLRVQQALKSYNAPKI
ncbi:MAG TPA: response regulator [Flavobacteriia bacterium]|nr:response regulator [Flavobacteriia bacterium]